MILEHFFDSVDNSVIVLPILSITVCIILISFIAASEKRKWRIAPLSFFMILSIAVFAELIESDAKEPEISGYYWCEKCVTELRDNKLFFFHQEQIYKVNSFTDELFFPNDTIFFCFASTKKGILKSADLYVIKRENPIKLEESLTIQPDTVRLQIDSLGILTH